MEALQSKLSSIENFQIIFPILIFKAQSNQTIAIRLIIQVSNSNVQNKLLISIKIIK